MQKVLKIFSVFLIAAAICIALKMFDDRWLGLYADYLYNNKKYSSACKIYEQIYSAKPKNKEYLYKKTLCLSQMPLTYSVQKKLLQIAQTDNGSEAEKLATEIIERFRNIKNLHETYINSAINGDVVIRWSKKSFPLKIFVEDFPQIPDYYKTEVINSFNSWERETDNLVSFVPVKNSVAADIVVQFRPTATGDSNHEEGEYKAAVTTPLIVDDNFLKQMKITCIIKTKADEFFTPEQIKTLFTHEIGHALGIWGHPEDIDSIMYYSLNNSYDYYEKRIDTGLSQKDINTLSLLYELAPDITSDRRDLEQKEDFIYLPFLIYPLQNSKRILLNNFKDNFMNNPKDMTSAFSLADMYNSDGEYDESNKLMLFLLDNTDNINMKSVLCYNIANNYINLHDFDKAMFYAKKAEQFSNTTENNTLTAYIKFLQGDVKNAEKEFLAIIRQNPDFINAYFGLVDLYIKQHAFLKARKVLKELINRHRKMLTDGTLDKYKLLIFDEYFQN